MVQTSSCQHDWQLPLYWSCIAADRRSNFACQSRLIPTEAGMSDPRPNLPFDRIECGHKPYLIDCDHVPRREGRGCDRAGTRSFHEMPAFV